MPDYLIYKDHSRSNLQAQLMGRLGGSTIFQKFEFDLVQLIHGAYHISKHSEGN